MGEYDLQNKKQNVAQTKTSTIEFGDKIKVGDFEVPGQESSR